MLSRQELIDALCRIVVDCNEGPGGKYLHGRISSRVIDLLKQEGALVRCSECNEWYPTGYYQCPWTEQHECPDCGYAVDDCVCDNCPDCCCAECECPRCRTCGGTQSGCECPEEEASFA